MLHVAFYTKQYATKALTDTLLLDALFFSNAHKNLQIIKEYTRVWFDSIKTKEYRDSVPRSDIREILARINPAIRAISESRKWTIVNDTAYIDFLNEYFVVRQLLDDLTDFEDDRTIGIHSYAQRHGKDNTLMTLKQSVNRIQNLPIPLFYKQIINLYSQFFLVSL